MAGIVQTIRVKPWGEGQGDFVEINEDDFNPDVHQLLEADATVGIPADWTELHWKRQVALARLIIGGTDEITADKAKEIITAELAKRAA